MLASNIIVDGDWIIGSSSGTNRISNPGTVNLAHTLQISNAVEQLGRFILTSNATIDLAGDASRLTFANSSGEDWAAGVALMVDNWNGNPSGGGAEQLTFGTGQTGLAPGQLNQIHFRVADDLYSAKILDTGEVVPDKVLQPSIAFVPEGNTLVLTWTPGWSLESATNVAGPYFSIPDAILPYTNNMTMDPELYFRLKK